MHFASLSVLTTSMIVVIVVDIVYLLIKEILLRIGTIRPIIIPRCDQYVIIYHSIGNMGIGK